MDARAANITSAVALFPGQVTGGWMGRKNASGTPSLSFRALVILSLIGGAVGAVLLLLTPSTVFARMVPWLVLFATAAFAYGSFGRKPVAAEDGSDSPHRTMPLAASSVRLRAWYATQSDHVAPVSCAP